MRMAVTWPAKEHVSGGGNIMPVWMTDKMTAEEWCYGEAGKDAR